MFLLHVFIASSCSLYHIKFFFTFLILTKNISDIDLFIEISTKLLSCFEVFYNTSHIFIELLKSHCVILQRHRYKMPIKNAGINFLYLRIFYFKYFLRYLPVYDFSHSAHSSGVPLNITVPPPIPPSGPKSII